MLLIVLYIVIFVFLASIGGVFIWRTIDADDPYDIDPNTMIDIYFKSIEQRPSVDERKDEHDGMV